MKNFTEFMKAFGHAWHGIIYCIKDEKHMRIHLFFAVLAISLSLYFRIPVNEWLMVIFSITLVITLEMLNTALERTIDMFIKELHPLAKIAKDVAAGAVLVAALNALIIGAVVFLPKICKYF
ncbi:MAG: diacylglycerol kinase family protein [Peptococcales bacterium]|jgi:undecaprenol kinase